MPVTVRLERLGVTFKKQENPACASCGYDPEWLLSLSAEDAALTKLFCDRCLVDAMLDAVNFNCVTPAAP